MKKSKKIISLLCAISMIMAVSIPVLAASEAIMPLSEPHCEYNGNIGRLISTTTTNTGRQTRNCEHGIVGGVDERTMTQQVTKWTCTYCDFESVHVGEEVWTDWTCLGK